MKIICINNGGEPPLPITIGKMYEALDTTMGMDGLMYKIINDEERESCYLVTRFVDAIEHRDRQINSILE